jgi:hypothetical protein
MYLDYYLRSLPQHWPTLIALGVKLGALSVYEAEDGESVVSTATPGCWDFIGVLHKPTGNLLPASFEGGEALPEMVPVTDEDGVAYWHANLRTTLDLGEVAREMAQTDPEIADAMRTLDLFFLLDAEGRPRAPARPARGYA